MILCLKCKEVFEPIKSERYCIKCAAQLGREKVGRKRRRIRNDSDVRDIWKRLQKEVNAMARAIDYGLPCLARNYHPNQMHGGHIFSVGSAISMRFNLHNIHRQSAQSNHHGNEDGLLRENLRKEYGEAYFEFLQGMRGVDLPSLPASDWMRILKDAREAKRYIQEEVKEPLDRLARIELRNSVNQDLGIYNNQFSTFNYE